MEPVKLKVVTTEENRTYFVPDKTLPMQEFTSVTTPIGIVSASALKVWAARMGEKEAEKIRVKASKRGTAIHDGCELVAKREVCNKADMKAKGIRPVYRKEIDKYLRWFEENVISVLAVETVVVSTELGVAGRIDLVARLNPQKMPKKIRDRYGVKEVPEAVWVLDIKTGTVREEKCRLQTAAYHQGIMETSRLLLDAAREYDDNFMDFATASELAGLGEDDIHRGIIKVHKNNKNAKLIPLTGRLREDIQGYRHAVGLYKYLQEV